MKYNTAATFRQGCESPSNLLQLDAEGDAAVRRELVEVDDVGALLVVDGDDGAVTEDAVRHAVALMEGRRLCLAQEARAEVRTKSRAARTRRSGSGAVKSRRAGSMSRMKREG